MQILFSVGRYCPTTNDLEFPLRELTARLAGAHEVAVATLVNHGDPDFLARLKKPISPSTYSEAGCSMTVLQAPNSRRLLRNIYVSLAQMESFAGLQWPCFVAAYRGQLEQLVGGAQLVHTVTGASQDLMRLTAQIAEKRGVPLIITPQLGFAEECHDLHQTLARADGVVALHEAEREWLVKGGVAQSKIELIEIGYNMPAFPPRGAFRQRRDIAGPLVLFLGRKETERGYRAVLEAADRIWLRYPNAHFVFLGPSSPEAQRDFLNWRGERRMIDLPAVDPRERAQILADCDLVCVPSLKEGLGLVYLETWSAARPLVAADTSLERARIADGEEGLLIPQDKNGVVEAVFKLIGNPALAQKLGAGGRRRVEQRHNWDAVTMKTAQFYERVLQQKLGSAAPLAAK